MEIKKDFSPTKDTALDLKRWLNDAQGRVNTFLAEKRDLETRLSVYNNKVRTNGYLPPKEYRDICKKQDEIKRAKAICEGAIAEIKNEINKKKILLNEVEDYFYDTGVKIEGGSLVINMVKLRDKYMAFSSDLTRVSSMRVMASQIAEDITDLINSAKADS